MNGGKTRTEGTTRAGRIIVRSKGQHNDGRSNRRVVKEAARRGTAEKQDGQQGREEGKAAEVGMVQGRTRKRKAMMEEYKMKRPLQEQHNQRQQ